MIEIKLTLMTLMELTNINFFFLNKSESKIEKYLIPVVTSEELFESFVKSVIIIL